MIRGNCYAVLRLHELLGAETKITNFEDGILVMVEADTQTFCLFVDCLIGEQQTVIKPMPLYISRSVGWIKSIAGCTILGDGSISLILDINGLMKKI
jgi:two-component system chemotaxis sensor kinase CheA